MRIPQIYSESDIPSRIPFTRQPPRDPQQVFEGLPTDIFRPRAQAGPGVAMFEALERAGSAIANLGDRALAALGTAEAKRRAAVEHLEGVEAYTGAHAEINRRVEAIERPTDNQGNPIAPDPFTHRQRVEDAFADVMKTTVAGTKSESAKRYVLENLSRLHVEVAGQARQYENRQLKDRGRAAAHEALTQREDDAIKAGDAGLSIAQDALNREYEDLVLRAWMTAEDAAKDKTARTERIVVERAKITANRAPKTFLDDEGAGKYNRIPEDRRRELREYAENRMRTLRSDAEAVRVAEERDVTRLQNQTAKELEQGIRSNYANDGSKRDMRAYIDLVARSLNESDYTRLQALNETYQTAAAKEERRSDPSIAGRYKYLIESGRFGEVTQEALLRSFQSHTAGGPGINQTDHARLSSALNSERDQAATRRDKQEADAERTRKELAKQGEDLLRDSLVVGKLYDPTRAVDRFEADYLNEYRDLVRANPDKDPRDLADEVLARAAARVETIARDVQRQYKTKDDVRRAYEQGLILKGTAERYHRILDAIEKSAATKPKTPGTPVEGLRTPRPSK